MKTEIFPKFVKKVNLCIAMVILLILGQGFVSAIFFEQDASLYAHFAFLFLAFVYLVFCLNGFLERIFLTDTQIIIKNMFQTTSLDFDEIQKAEIIRKSATPTHIIFTTKTNQQIKISVLKFKNIGELLYLAKNYGGL